MRLNTKGQVTIPADLRQRHGFAPGDDVEVIEIDGVLRIVHAHELTRGQRAVRRVRGLLGERPTTDDIMGLTRGE